MKLCQIDVTEVQPVHPESGIITAVSRSLAGTCRRLFTYSFMSSLPLPPRMRMNPESRVIPGDGFRHSLDGRLEVLVSRVDVEPLLQDVVRGQLRELFDDSWLMRMFGADQHAMPLPPGGPGSVRRRSWSVRPGPSSGGRTDRQPVHRTSSW
jgi:hypothetical protein